MITALIVGCGFGLGLHLLIRGLRPPLPNLSAAVSQVLSDGQRQVPEAPPSEGPASLIDRLERRQGHALVESLHALGVNVKAEDKQRDLRVTGRRPEAWVTEKVVGGVGGLVLPFIFFFTLALVGWQLPFPLVLVSSLLLGVGCFLLPDVQLRAAAEARRRSFRHALSAFLDLASISLAGGGLVQGAMRDAVAVGRGWEFEQFARPLELTQQKGRAPWHELGQIGEDLGVPELSELTSSLMLAGSEGARVRQSLSAKAESLRARRIAEAEAEAAESSEKMSLPLAVLGVGFVLFIGFAAMGRVFSGLG